MGSGAGSHVHEVSLVHQATLLWLRSPSVALVGYDRERFARGLELNPEWVPFDDIVGFGVMGRAAGLTQVTLKNRKSLFVRISQSVNHHNHTTKPVPGGDQRPSVWVDVRHPG